MDQPPQMLSGFASLMVWVALWACAGFWLTVFWRRRAGTPLLPLEPRRDVPWQGIDLAMILAVYLIANIVVGGLSYVMLGPEADKPIESAQSDTSHFVLRLFREGDTWTMVLCVVAAVVVAPLVEEMLFRLFLQGWLEAFDRRIGRSTPGLRRWLPWGVWPVVVASLLFALPHFHIKSPQLNPEYLRFMMIGNAAAGLVTVAFALVVALLRGATVADLGYVREKWLADAGLGLGVFAGVAAPIYAGQMALLLLLPDYLAPDPFVLFPFALILGVLYCRTHRILPSIVLHAALNATSLLMLWLMLE